MKLTTNLNCRPASLVGRNSQCCMSSTSRAPVDRLLHGSPRCRPRRRQRRQVLASAAHVPWLSLRASRRLAWKRPGARRRHVDRALRSLGSGVHWQHHFWLCKATNGRGRNGRGPRGHRGPGGPSQPAQCAARSNFVHAAVQHLLRADRLSPARETWMGALCPPVYRTQYTHIYICKNQSCCGTVLERQTASFGLTYVCVCVCVVRGSCRCLQLLSRQPSSICTYLHAHVHTCIWLYTYMHFNMT